MPDFRAPIETAVVAQLATEAAFAWVKAFAEIGFASPTAYPAVTVTYEGFRTESVENVAGYQHTQGYARFFVTVAAASSQISGEARLGAAGTYALLQKVFDKLSAFVPAIDAVFAEDPCEMESEEPYDVEGNFVAWQQGWRVYLQIRGPVLSL